VGVVVANPHAPKILMSPRDEALPLGSEPYGEQSVRDG
jgi:hypothetical protein